MTSMSNLKDALHIPDTQSERDERRCEKQIAFVEARTVVVVVTDWIGRRRLLVIAEGDRALERGIQPLHVVLRLGGTHE